MKIQKRNKTERGMTYVSVAISALLVGLVLASYLRLVSSQNQNTMRSQAWNRTVAVIEAGIEEALAHLNQNAAPDANGSFMGVNLATDGWVKTAGGWSKSNGIGDDHYIVSIGNFTPGTTNPDIVAEGFVKPVPAYASISKFAPWLAQIAPLDSTRAAYVRRQVICNTTNVPVFSKALVAKDTIDISGNNVTTDSFDSGNPLWSTDRRYDPTKIRDNGDIASNRGVTNSLSPVNLGNANIKGRVSTGPNVVNPGTAVISIGSNGKVGSLGWHARNDTSGKIEPGWSTDDMNVEFPEVKLPFESGPPPSRLKFDGTPLVLDGVTYDYVFLVPGDYRLGNNEILRGNIYVGADVRLLVPQSGKINMSGDNRIVIATNGSLKLYADCPTVSMGGRGVQNPNVATNFYYFGTERNTSLAYGGNSSFTGVFYAPNAFISMGGGGGTTIDFSGAGIFRAVKMTGNFTFHYDENLQRIGLYRGYVLTSWNEM